MESRNDAATLPVEANPNPALTSAPVEAVKPVENAAPESVVATVIAPTAENKSVEELPVANVENKPETAPAVAVEPRVQDQPQPVSGVLARQKMLDEYLLDLVSSKGESEKIVNILGVGANINALDAQGMTALHLALLAGHKDIAKLLLTKEVKLFNAVNSNNNLTALQTLANKGHCEMMSWLLDLHAKKEILKSIEIDFEQLYKIANPEAKKLLANLQLYKAAKEGNMTALKSALDKGAEINAKTANGDTALHMAVECGHYEIMRFLVRHENIDLSLENNNRQSARNIADAKKDHVAIHVFANQSLLLAVKANELKSVENALHDGAKISEAKNRKGAGVLHSAARKGYAAMLELLIRHSEAQDFVEKDHGNQIPLHKAFRSGNAAVVKLLLRQHAKYILDIKEADAEGKIPVDLCSKDGKPSTDPASKDLAYKMVEKFGGYKKEEKLARNNRLKLSFFGSNVESEVRMPEIHTSQLMKPGSKAGK